MSPRTGRPPSDDPKHNRVETKMTDSELEKLDYCCKESGKTRSEVIRDGIDIIYKRLNKLNKK